MLLSYYYLTKECELLVRIEVNTIGLEKANTIAIYGNETVFNGHYQKQERMNIIQLYVNADTSLGGTPFVEGPNAIVIPTSLFTKTLLNKKIQDEQLNETALYAENKCEFISIERNGETEEACDEVDFVFIRFDISGEEAMVVLNMLLTCLVNDTTNETAIAYKYVSTKQNGTESVLMNLPITALGYIPWLCNYENSVQGRTPHEFGDWLIEKLKAIVNFVVAIFVAIWSSIISIWQAVIEYIGKVLMSAIQWIAYMMWLLIRAIIFIVMWILFAITFVLILFAFLALYALVTVFVDFLELSITYEYNRIIIEKDEFQIILGYTLESHYIEYFDLEVPTMFIYFEKGNTTIGTAFNFFSGLNMPEFNLSEDFYEVSSSSQKKSSNLRASSTDSNQQYSDFLNGMATMLAIFGVFMSIFGLAAILTSNDVQKVVIWVFIITVMVISLRLFFANLLLSGGLSDNFMVGASIGSFIAALAVSMAAGKILPYTGFLEKIPATFTVLYATFTFYWKLVGGFIPDLWSIFSGAAVIFGIFTVILGVIAIKKIPSETLRDIFALSFFFIEFAISLYFCFAPIFNHLAEL